MGSVERGYGWVMYDLHVILTGGTIDSHYDPTRDTAVPNDKSVIP